MTKPTRPHDLPLFSARAWPGLNPRRNCSSWRAICPRIHGTWKISECWVAGGLRLMDFEPLITLKESAVQFRSSIKGWASWRKPETCVNWTSVGTRPCVLCFKYMISFCSHNCPTGMPEHLSVSQILQMRLASLVQLVFPWASAICQAPRWVVSLQRRNG